MMKQLILAFVIIFVLNNVYATDVTVDADIGHAPNVTFLSQNPADLNITNAQNNKLYISYNVTDSVNLNDSTVKLYYKANSTIDNTMYFLNGTAYSGFFDDSHSLSPRTNVTSNYTWTLLDNEIYPGTFNFGSVSMDRTFHAVVAVSTANNYVKTEYYNVSNSKQWGYFEIMTNSTSTAAPSRVYYCNSSYTTGNILTSSNCALISTRLATTTFDHWHTNNSAHIGFQFAVNTTLGTIGSVKITSTSYFVFGGATNWGVYNIANTTRIGMTQTTTNRGTAWTNQTYTVDQHFHQFDNNENQTFWYYVCANDTSGNQNCSDIRLDLMEMAGLPPSSPQVYAPVEAVYSGNITINYTASLSPNAYNISYYNISLANVADNSFNKTIIANNSFNLGYIWDSTGTTKSQYVIKVRAYDVLGQSSLGYSDNITIINAPTVDTVTDLTTVVPGTTITFRTNVSDIDGYAYLSTVNLTCWGSTSSESASDGWDHYTNMTPIVLNVNATMNQSTFTIVTNNHAINGSWTCKVWVNDSNDLHDSETDSFTMNTRVGILLNETDFTASENPGTNDKAYTNSPVKITHDGNILMDVSVQGTDLMNATWVNLSYSDTDGWSRSSNIYGLAYDSIHNLVYTGTSANDAFGVYNASDGIWYNLSATDPLNWAGTESFNSIVYDPINDLVYTGLNNLFGVYNASSNVWTDLTALGLTGKNVYGVGYDSTNDLVYTGCDSGWIGLYNHSDNIWYNLSDVDTDDWIGTNSVYAFTYDTSHDLMYLATETQYLGVYNKTSNVLTNLTDIGGAYSLAYDSVHNFVYTGGNSYFGVYNESDGIWYDLSSYMNGGGGPIQSVVYDSIHNLVYIGRQLNNEYSFSIYDATSHNWIDLNNRDVGNWSSLYNVFSLAYDSTNNRIYVGGIEPDYGNTIFGVISDLQRILVGNETYDETSLPGTVLTYSAVDTQTLWARGTYPTAATEDRQFWIDFPNPLKPLIYTGTITFTGSAS